jgi:hypothetical protein
LDDIIESFLTEAESYIYNSYFKDGVFNFKRIRAEERDGSDVALKIAKKDKDDRTREQIIQDTMEKVRDYLEEEFYDKFRKNN